MPTTSSLARETGVQLAEPFQVIRAWVLPLYTPWTVIDFMWTYLS